MRTGSAVRPRWREHEREKESTHMPPPMLASAEPPSSSSSSSSRPRRFVRWPACAPWSAAIVCAARIMGRYACRGRPASARCSHCLERRAEGTKTHLELVDELGARRDAEPPRLDKGERVLVAEPGLDHDVGGAARVESQLTDSPQVRVREGGDEHDGGRATDAVAAVDVDAPAGRQCRVDERLCSVGRLASARGAQKRAGRERERGGRTAGRCGSGSGRRRRGCPGSGRRSCRGSED